MSDSKLRASPMSQGMVASEIEKHQAARTRLEWLIVISAPKPPRIPDYDYENFPIELYHETLWQLLQGLHQIDSTQANSDKSYVSYMYFSVDINGAIVRVDSRRPDMVHIGNIVGYQNVEVTIMVLGDEKARFYHLNVIEHTGGFRHTPKAKWPEFKQAEQEVRDIHEASTAIGGSRGSAAATIVSSPTGSRTGSGTTRARCRFGCAGTADLATARKSTAEHRIVSHNTAVHRLVRVMVRPLLRTSITPNHLTVLRLLTGLCAAAAFALGSAETLFWGSIVYLVSCFLDRADGELARAANMRSEWGHKFDIRCDFVVNVLVFVGIGAGLRHGDLGNWACLLGLVAGLAIGSIYYGMMLVDKARGGANGDKRGPIVDADDFLFLIAPIIWLGWTETFVWATVLGAPLFSALVYWHWHRLRSGLSEQGT